MKDTSSKVIPLRPSSFEESVESDILVNRLIGPGVTVIATPQDKDHLRYIFCEQMAVAVAKGEKFLGHFETIQGRVLLIAHGVADFKGMEERGIVTTNKYVETRHKWPRIGDGCIEELRSYKKVHPDFKLAFLGNFDFIKGIIGTWIEKERKIKEKSLIKSYTIMDYFNKDMEIENIQRLRNFGFEDDVAIVVGHDLTQNNTKLLYTRGLYKCDTEIHIREADEVWRLKVVPKRHKMHIQTNSWDIIFDHQNFFQMHERQIREVRAMEAKSKGKLPLNDKEMKIIDAMWGGGPMSVKQIAEATGISRSTVDQKLKALERSDKGEWIVSLDGERGKLYMADPNRERDWL